jgi:signal transduction histidine kinase
MAGSKTRGVEYTGDEMEAAPSPPIGPTRMAEADFNRTASARGFRFALGLGFGGMLLIFLVAGVDAVRLLRGMRAENKILRDASLERSQRLASIRTYVLLSQAYMGDYFMDGDERRSVEHKAQVQEAWSRMRSDVGSYRTSTLAEALLVKRLQELLDQHWQRVNRAMTWTVEERRRQGASFYGNEIAPVRTAVLEITTQVADVNARQLASAESQIQNEFERLGRRLSVVLQIAMASALVLAIGCFLYILKIERQNKRRYEQIVEARAELERLSRRMVAAQEEERRSISRELHDQIGQTLSAVLVDTANLANRISPDDAVAQRYLESIRTLADSSVNSIRNIALLLRPSMLDDLGLIPALEWQAREVSRRSGIKVKVTDENVPESLPDTVRTGIYRIVQEALHNIARHSGAKNAKITVSLEHDAICLAVEDDGTGFDPKRTRGLGLIGMEERVKQLGGRMEIQSNPGGGTRLRVTLPLASQAAAKGPEPAYVNR